MQRKCTKCGVTQDETNSRKRGKTFYSWCNVCANKARLVSYHKNPKKYLDATMKNRNKNLKAYYERQKVGRRKLKADAVNHYGGKCACCNETQIEFLTIDHINGGGNQHRKELNGRNIYYWLKENGYPAGFQVLCCNCNMAKGWYGVCPHTLIQRQ